MLIAIFDDRVEQAVADRFPGHDVRISRVRESTAEAFLDEARGAQVIGVRRISGFELTPETERLIGARELALMKPITVLVDCSRGRVLDEGALHEALATADQVSGLIENLELFLTGRRPQRLANPEILDLGTARAKHLQTS